MKKTKTPARKPKAASSERKESAPPYDPTPQERSAIKAYLAKREEEAIPWVAVSGDKHITIKHPDPQVGAIMLAKALGCISGILVDGILHQLMQASTFDGKIDENVFNYWIKFVASLKPRDELEAVLITQMALTHSLTTTLARRLRQAETIPQQDAHERAFNKIARTFCTQVETLRRQRNGGEQKVTVKHVTVNSGGQAIVGNVNHSGALQKPEDTPALTDQGSLSLLALPDCEPEGVGVSLEKPESTS